MAETKAQAEPTMEEILASIRRIISEDDPAGEEAAAGAQASAGKSSEEARAAAEEILDLTKKLNEDGTVVDLSNPQAAGNGAAAPEQAPVSAPEPAAEPEPQPEPAMAAEPEPEPEPEPEMAAEPEPEPVADAMVAPDAGPEPEPDPEPDAAAATDPFADVAADPPADPLADGGDSILAPLTQAATTSALGAVSKAVAGNRRTVQVGDGRTLEEIVREALTPQLKAWLDANLATLVEQIVRDEIKKMVRRAEDQ